MNSIKRVYKPSIFSALKLVFIFAIYLVIFTPFALAQIGNRESILIVIILGSIMLGMFFLFFLNHFKSKAVIDGETIKLKALFKNDTYNISEIKYIVGVTENTSSDKNRGNRTMDAVNILRERTPTSYKALSEEGRELFSVSVKTIGNSSNQSEFLHILQEINPSIEYYSQLEFMKKGIKDIITQNK